MLEVIDKGCSTESHPMPLLFVHGAWHGAWCWDEHFLDFFADKGYRAVALSLRGHGNSPEGKRMQTCSIADHVADVGSVADKLPSRPVVVGHSMGGFIVQKYLESHDAPASVLLAPMPSRGVGGFLLRELKRHPFNTVRAIVTTKALCAVDTPKLVRQHFFSRETPESDVVRCAERLGQEYVGRTVLDELLLNLPKTERVTTPMLVLGAACDGTFTTKEVHATAHAYRTEAQIFPDMGHDMMLEPGWAAVAERIHGWLAHKGL